MSAPRKTVTLERYHCWGTPHHQLRLLYRGRPVSWWWGGYHVYSDARDYGAESVQAKREQAKKQGFTHVRIVGDWNQRTKPKGGKL